MSVIIDPDKPTKEPPAKASAPRPFPRRAVRPARQKKTDTGFIWIMVAVLCFTAAVLELIYMIAK